MVYNFLDVNKDGKISINEFKKLEKSNRSKLVNKREKFGKDVSKSSHNLSRTMCILANKIAEKHVDLPSVFQTFDSNNDNHISF